MTFDSFTMSLFNLKFLTINFTKVVFYIFITYYYEHDVEETSTRLEIHNFKTTFAKNIMLQFIFLVQPAVTEFKIVLTFYEDFVTIILKLSIFNIPLNATRDISQGGKCKRFECCWL